MLVAWDLHSSQIICTEAHFIKCNSRSLWKFSLGSEELLLQCSNKILGAEKNQKERSEKDQIQKVILYKSVCRI